MNSREGLLLGLVFVTEILMDLLALKSPKSRVRNLLRKFSTIALVENGLTCLSILILSNFYGISN